jgi:hypothetical protein
VTAPSKTEETTYRGIRWRRQPGEGVAFYDPDGNRWVDWGPGVDAPPRPPGWGDRRARPGYLSHWRLIPLVITIAVVIIAVLQVVGPSSNNVKKEASASAAMLGKCLSQDGTALGHPKYSSIAVSCTSPKASVKVVKVVPSTPGSPLCPAGTTGVELPYAGVQYPHVECLGPVGSPPTSSP